MPLCYDGAVDWSRLRSRFRLLRETSGLSQDAVGALVGKTGAAVSHFELGTFTPRMKNLEAYVTAIDAEVVIEIVPKADADLIQRLADVLPWVDPNARLLLQQAVKMAELQKAPEPQAPAELEPDLKPARLRRRRKASKSNDRRDRQKQ